MTESGTGGSMDQARVTHHGRNYKKKKFASATNRRGRPWNPYEKPYRRDRQQNEYMLKTHDLKCLFTIFFSRPSRKLLLLVSRLVKW